jgi:hypothetical protein
VTASTSDALSVFGRNPSNGVLAQVQVIYANGNNPAFDGAWEIGLSPDGTAVYATGTTNSSVVALHSANPVATLSTLLPASAQAGSPETTVRVQGEEFVPGAVVRVGNVARPSTYISPNEMEVAIPASDLTIAGTTWSIDVVNPEPGGGVSNNFLIFTVTDPADNPIPSIDYLQPQGAEGLAPIDSLAGGATSLEALMTRFVRAVERNDTASLERLALSRQDFAWVFYPTNPQAAPPYDLSPGLFWFLLEGRSRKGLGRLLVDRGGRPLKYAGVRCDSAVSREGENTVRGPCAVLRIQGRDTVAERLFGLVIERRGRWKFVSYANRLD